MAIEGKIKLLDDEKSNFLVLISCVSSISISGPISGGHKYSQAIALYTQVIKLNSENVVYWANRVFAHIKLKEYCSVIEDGAKAIEIVPIYSKGYYRREAAYLAMGSSKTIQEFSRGWYCFLNILSCISCILLVIIKLFLFFILKLYYRIYLEKNIAYVTSYHI
ncbi:protein SGT1 homolog [Lycium ferocissimum]|uniref:protein SGT1 homolog n=1 Tax=Lycium ferocissimum TaxID=112874 RepID=UPI0028150C24|nr:protein SGT1 homolog [Lycium ferocissimum]